MAHTDENQKESIMNGIEKIELLAPAGDLNSLKVAIGNGANSVYFGSNYFSARKKAKNIPEEDMEEAIDYAHLRSCKIYLALNTLLLDDELDLAVDLAKVAYQCGIDAIIVQDFGFAALLKKQLPDITLHASTQATIYDEYAIDACACVGFSRIILPRELSIDEIARLTAYAKTKGIETEVFVHGALCVCYSGQCIMSSMIGGRSGNRGECAQPCRLPYDVTVQKRPKNLIAPHLATKDISAIDHIEQLILAGVAALKIEGRMRSVEYVGEVTNEFSKQIKFVINKIKFDRFEPSIKGLENGSMENLLLAFNRGGKFSDHYLVGKKSPEMIAGTHVGSFGVLLGEIAAKNSQIGVLDIRKTNDVIATLFPDKGDVIAIRRQGKEEEIASAPIGSAVANGSNIRIKGFHPAIIDTMQIGDLAYRMSHSQLAKEVLTSEKSKTQLAGVLRGNENGISLEWTVTKGIAKGIVYEEHFKTEPKSSVIIPAMDSSEAHADNKNNSDNLNPSGKDSLNSSDLPARISEQRCVEQLSKTGGTPFVVESIIVESAPAIPVSALNLIRRESLAGISEKIRQSFKKMLPECHYTEQNIDNNGYSKMPLNESSNIDAKSDENCESSNNENCDSSNSEENILQNENNTTRTKEVIRSTEFQDYSAVENLISQIDIFDSEEFAQNKDTMTLNCKNEADNINTKSTTDMYESSKKCTSAKVNLSKNSISAYFYSWDGTAASIACGADWYELPVWAFLKENALDGLHDLIAMEPDAKIAIALPPAYIGKYRLIILDLLKKLAQEGIEAIVSGNPGNGWLCQELGLENFQDSGTNVLNSCTATLIQEFGATSIVASVELALEPLMEIAKNSFEQTGCLLELPAYGKLRLMYSEHCPVGYNRSGCKACETGAAMAIKDRKGMSFPVICHKETCTVDILNGDNLCVPSEIVELTKHCQIRARLYFTDETAQERKMLTKGFGDLIRNPKSSQTIHEIEKVRRIAVDIASSRNNGLTKGHYQRGMH